jgi:predicted tellurium resistance membrane protein TerC
MELSLSLADPNVWASFATLAALEIVLGIDNVIFIAIVAEKLPERSRAAARRLGLVLALVVRLALLAGAGWIIGLSEPIFTLLDHAVSWRDVLLIGGGLFLLAKGTWEIHDSVEGDDHGAPTAARAVAATYLTVIGQIVVLDIVFSIDSIMTAVGMTDQLSVMWAAVIVSMLVMMFAAGPVAGFVHRHPTVKMLALSFLLLIGVALIADGIHFHIPRGYIYFAVAFSVTVEALNLLAARRRRRAAERS